MSALIVRKVNGFFSGVGLSPLGTAANSGLLYKPQMIHEGDCGALGRMKIGRGKPKYSEKTYPSVTLSTTNPTWPDPGSNPGHRGGKPATNRLSYGAAKVNVNNVKVIGYVGMDVCVDEHDNECSRTIKCGQYFA
jgi:hypothetical protein